MKNIDWKRKLPSRKHTTAVPAFLTIIILATAAAENSGQQWIHSYQ